MYGQLFQPTNISVEYNLGTHIPGNGSLPEHDPAQSLSLLFSHPLNGSHGSAVDFFKRPEAGFSFSYHHLGNNEVLGNQVSLIPFVQLYPFNGRRDVHFLLGLGMAYNFNPFTPENRNVWLGSHFAWQLRMSLFWQIIEINKQKIYFTAGLDHTSNGHTVLPNAALNKGYAGIAWSIDVRDTDALPDLNNLESTALPDYTSYVFMRSFIGFHELGGTFGPVGGPNYFIKGIDVGLIKNINPGIRVLALLSARQYDSFYQYLENNPADPLSDSLFKNASALSLRVGGEFGINRVFFKTELGVDLYKPFYERFFEEYDTATPAVKAMRKYISGLYGLEFYLFKPEKQARFNLSLGAHVVTNFAKADFTQVSLTAHHRL